MGILNEISNNIKEFIVTFLTNDVWRIALGVVVIVVALLCKSFIGKCLFRLIEKQFKNKGKAGTVVEDVIKMIDRPVQLAVVTAGIYICGTILRLPDGFRSILSKAVSSLIMLCVYWVLYNASAYVKVMLGKITQKSETHLDDIAANYLVYALKAIVMILGALSILQAWVGDITSLLAGLSIGGVAFALAAQDTAANLFGSITVMLDHPFEIGEYIEIGGCAGTVEKMGLRSTKIRTLDQSLIIIPNKTMSSSNITNWSKIDRRRVTFTIGLTYSTTSEQLKEAVARIKNMLLARADIRHEGIMVGFSEFGASSLDIAVRFYTLTGDIADAVTTKEKVNFAIMDIVSDMGLSFAFPSQSVYVESLPDRSEQK